MSEAFAIKVLVVLSVALLMALAVALTALALLWRGRGGGAPTGAGWWKTKEELATLRRRAQAAGRYEAFNECWEAATPEERQKIFGFDQWPLPEEKKDLLKEA